MATDEFYTPKEFTEPSEFPKVKEVFISSPEFLDRPVGYGTTERKAPEKTRSRASQIRKMMMYLAATVTSMGSLLMFSTEGQKKNFDMREYIKTHRDWYSPDDDEYIYMGDNGLAWIAQRSDDGQVFNDFYHYKKWCYLFEETGEYTFNGYGYDIDWSKNEIDSEKVNTFCRFIKTDDGFIVEAYDEGDSSLTQRIYPVDPGKADYPGKQYMLKYLDMSTKDILSEFNTYVLENDAPIYRHIEKITFKPDGTGVFRIKGKDRVFTYLATNDKADNFITINYNGRRARACFNFYGEKPTMMFFGGLENDPRSFAAFIAVDPEKAEEKISSNKNINSGENNLPRSPDDPDEPGPAGEEAKPADASYLQIKRDWYCKELNTYIFFGEKGMGYAFNEDGPDRDDFYSRFTYKISGSVCELWIQRFDFQSLKHKTEEWSFTAIDDGGKIRLRLDSSGKNLVFEQYPKDLFCYVDDLAGMRISDILLKYKRFNIIEDSFVVNGITTLEFTDSNSGIIRYNKDGKSEEHPFTYSADENGGYSTFYLDYNGEKYLGQIFYSRSGPGITLFNPAMDGTHGKFSAG